MHFETRQPVVEEHTFGEYIWKIRGDFQFKFIPLNLILILILGDTMSTGC